MPKALFAVALAALVCLAPPIGGRDAQWIEQRLQEIKRSDPAAWKAIPWVATLTEARALSAREKRPVFLFTHDGNLETGRC